MTEGDSPDRGPIDLTPAIESKAWRHWTKRLIDEVREQSARAKSASEAHWDAAVRVTMERLAVEEHSLDDRAAAEAYLRVLSDLGRVGWSIRVEESETGNVAGITGERPRSDDRTAKRKQLNAARAQALRKRSVRSFVKRMERPHSHKGEMHSIFSLVRDGRDLVAAFRSSEDGWESVIRPYVQVVSEDARCEMTGFDLGDVWRYFRLTWSNPPRSIPARQMRFLIRDAAGENHPVMGIGELSGAAIKVAARDQFIGWDPQGMEDWMLSEDAEEVVCWIEDTLDLATSEIYSKDLPSIEGENLSARTVRALREIESAERERHESSGGARKGLASDPREVSKEEWLEQALTPLFRSKRAGRLATLADLRIELQPLLEEGDGPALRRYLKDTSGRDAIARVLTLAKSRRQGTAIADLTVCGAIAPYNHVIGGKLVALLAGAPAVVRAYEDRYTGAPSIIASSMAGRPIVKEAKLVLISTTGLFGTRPSQYDRITVEAQDIGGDSSERLRYSFLSQRTEGWGTFHFSRETAAAVQRWLRQKENRTRVSYQYGEGASPTFRLLREGLGKLGLDVEELLVHGLQKSLYVYSLVRNARRYLIGMDSDPDYLLPLDSPNEVSECIGRWWASRWASKRASEDDLATIEYESLIHPITHSARVVLPEAEEQVPLFPTK